jgi:hypothetical protein
MKKTEQSAISKRDVVKFLNYENHTAMEQRRKQKGMQEHQPLWRLSRFTWNCAMEVMG